MADLTVVTGEENAGQEVAVPVPGRASPLRLRFTPGGPSGGITPLSTVLFADVGTVLDPTLADGSIAKPFATLQDAIDASPVGGTIYLTPGNYGNTNLLQADAQFYGMSAKQSVSGAVEVGGITLDMNTVSYFENMSVSGDINGSSAVEFLNCFVSSFTVNAAGSIGARLSSVLSLTGTNSGSFFAENCFVGSVAAFDTISLSNCSINGNVESTTVAGTLTIRNCTFASGAVTLTATTIDIDAESLRNAVFAGCTFVGAVSGFSGANLTWGRNSALLVGAFPNPGIALQNYTGADVFTEARNQVFAPRRGVLCFLVAKSTVIFKFTVRINGVDTALAVTVNNSTVRDTTHFVEVQAGDLVSLQAQDGGDPAASGGCLASCVYV